MFRCDDERSTYVVVLCYTTDREVYAGRSLFRAAEALDPGTVFGRCRITPEVDVADACVAAKEEARLRSRVMRRLMGVHA